MEKVFIKPRVAGTVVRHPEKLSYRIPDDGEEVTLTPQWQRYIDSGDVEIITPSKVSDDKHSKGGSK